MRFLSLFFCYLLGKAGGRQGSYNRLNKVRNGLARISITQIILICLVVLMVSAGQTMLLLPLKFSGLDGIFGRQKTQIMAFLSSSPANLPAIQKPQHRAKTRKIFQAETLVRINQLDDGFHLLEEVRPYYPPWARWRNESGWVELELFVDIEGRVRRLRLLNESNALFGEAAVVAWNRARFTPPTVKGKPVKVRWRQMIYFKP